MIEFVPGTDAHGRVHRAGGRPVYERSRCGRYHIVRAYTKNEGDGYAWRSEVWFISGGSATNLDARLSPEDAVKLVEEHANALAGEAL